MLAPEDANQLAAANLSLVGYRVNALMARVPQHVNRDDLASAGYMALVKASRQFNPDLGVPFSSYASTRIHGALLDELRAADFMSRQARQRANAYLDVRERLAVVTGRTPTDAEVAEALGTDRARIATASASSKMRCYSLDQPGVDVAALNVPDEAAGPEDVAIASEQVDDLFAAMADLPERLRYVLSQLYLADRPAADVAAELGVTRSRVSQMRWQALRALRRSMGVPDPQAELADQDAPSRSVTEVAVVAAAASRAAAAALAGMPDEPRTVPVEPLEDAAELAC